MKRERYFFAPGVLEAYARTGFLTRAWRRIVRALRAVRTKRRDWS